jgi:enamine deaminase RidA (YjgF/YER057c/UK114 family)
VDLLAQGWLGYAQEGGRVAEVKLLGEHDEGVQLLQGEFRAHSIRLEISGHACDRIRRICADHISVRCMTERRAILSGSTFEEQIGYTRAVVDGDWVHVSGTTGFDYASMTISDDVMERAQQCLRNIEGALAEAKCTFADVVRVRYLLPDRADFEPCWPVLRRCFGEANLP